jgi:hypothetical protein
MCGNFSNVILFVEGNNARHHGQLVGIKREKHKRARPELRLMRLP